MNTDPHNKPLSADAAINQARDFLQQYYSDTLNHEKPSQPKAVREKEVLNTVINIWSKQPSLESRV